MYSYKRTHPMRPPAPVIDLVAMVPGDPSFNSQSEAIVDTGATITCVPTRIIDELGRDRVIAGKPVEVKAALKSSRANPQESYFLDVRLGNCFFPRLRVLVLPDMDYALIGRDILNDYLISFDAPNKTWSVAASCA